MNLPIGVQRLLAIAALREGLSLDEYVQKVLYRHAEQISLQEIRREKVEMRLELQANTGHFNYWAAWRREHERKEAQTPASVPD